MNGVQKTLGDSNLYPANVARFNNYIGRSNWSSDPYFTGNIDDFRVYKRVLTPTEVSTLYSYT
jgi:hypothetical protein